MMKADILLEKEMILEIRAEEEKEMILEIRAEEEKEERLKDYLKILERRQEK
ncbi:hypothetical protein [uncultured Merdimonas sp.]|uniref:hypothetical protein n=1 Tax=uncultured Merdimonas sp. TaxID=2023269 RepID=UPI00320B1109